MTRTRLLHGDYVCFDCSIKTTPKYLEHSFAPESSSKERYMEVKHYFDRSEQLQKIFHMTGNFGDLYIDEEHGIFYVDEGLFTVPLYLDMRELKEASLEFLPVDGHRGLMGTSVTGVVSFKFNMNTQIGAQCGIIENYRASATKQFMENNYVYTTPPEIAEFRDRFSAAWSRALYG